MPFYYKEEVISGGSSGSSVPPGGTTDQVLTKITDEDGDVEWRDGGIKQEAADQRYLQLSGGTMTGALKVPTPTEPSSAATKEYVDSAIGNIKGFVVQASAPSDTKLLWIDTNASTGGLKYYNGSAWVHVPVGYT